MKILIVLLIMLISKVSYACCSSPIAEVIYEAEISAVDLEYENDEKVFLITLKRKKEIYGSAPSEFKTRVKEYSASRTYNITLVKGKKYLVTLYEIGKHDKSMWLLPEKDWKANKLVLHPFIGIFNLESNEANLVINSYRYYENVKWTNDFRYINVFFWSSP